MALGWALLLSVVVTAYLWIPEKKRPAHVMYHDDIKFLIKDHQIMGCQHMHTPHELHFRGWAIQAAASYLRPGSKSAIVLGVGAGSVVKELRHREMQVRAVEIDPHVSRMARHEFGVGCSVGDGVDVIEHVRAGTHDLVFMDPYDGVSLESLWRFVNVETMRHAKVSFKDEETGLLVFNMVVAGETEADDDVLHRISAIMAAKYHYVRAFRDSPEETREGHQVIFFASDSKIDVEALADLPEIQGGEKGDENWVVRNFHKWQVLECTPEHCEGMQKNVPKSAPGKEYEERLKEKMKDVTGHYVPAERLYKTSTKIELQLAALAVSAFLAFGMKTQARGKTA